MALFLFAGLSSAVAAAQGSATGGMTVSVHTLTGAVMGRRQSTLGGQVDTFLGIPYAKPPVGDLRFRRPVPVDRWCDVYKAFTMPNACTQTPVVMFGDEFKGEAMWVSKSSISEDCLYANVWAPAEHSHRQTPLTPVMVWIYGGGFNGGSSDIDLYDGALMAARNNLIVVSFNYRTGVMGFLDVQTDEAPGNVGLLDQQLALKWVKENIIFFGGNPEQVTIAGESAGSMSVNFHLLSPGSRNLFSRAIMQSGSVYSSKAVLSEEEKFRSASRLAEAANCTQSDAKVFPNEIAKCLQKVPAGKLSLLELSLYQVPIKYAFSPTVDGFFIPDHPINMVEEGKFKKADLLMGTNENEGTFFLVYDFASHFSKDNSSLLTRQQAIDIVRTMFGRALGTKKLELLVNHYFKSVDTNDKASNRDIVGEILGDAIFVCPMNKFGAKMAEQGKRVYYYRFMHRSKGTPWAPWMGVMHGAEIEYMFGRAIVNKADYMSEEHELSMRMMDHWANFVHRG